MRKSMLATSYVLTRFIGFCGVIVSNFIVRALAAPSHYGPSFTRASTIIWLVNRSANGELLSHTVTWPAVLERIPCAKSSELSRQCFRWGTAKLSKHSPRGLTMQICRSLVTGQYRGRKCFSLMTRASS
jgi:hypothetical protein